MSINRRKLWRASDRSFEQVVRLAKYVGVKPKKTCACVKCKYAMIEKVVRAVQ
jgi:hypothetical protein